MVILTLKVSVWFQNIHTHPPLQEGWEIPGGWGKGIQGQKKIKEIYEAKLEFLEGGGGGGS